ncbi:Conserved_hypothetical protein [Hexamita inflata]|uniref:Uncharacterized protein n=1 Tax=Hexamita inflata TaxID=28002 RepID=A0AA86P4X2_9EUKA|nr:Conserved hypothetical protein [Hexamita inflata]
MPRFSSFVSDHKRYFQYGDTLFVQQVPLDASCAYQFSSIYNNFPQLVQDGAIFALKQPQQQFVYCICPEDYQYQLLRFFDFIYLTAKGVNSVLQNYDEVQMQFGGEEFSLNGKVQDLIGVHQNERIFLSVTLDSLKQKLDQLKLNLMQITQVKLEVRISCKDQCFFLSFYLALLPATTKHPVYSKIALNTQTLTLLTSKNHSPTYSKFMKDLKQKFSSNTHYILDLNPDLEKLTQFALLKNFNLLKGQNEQKLKLKGEDFLDALKEQADVYDVQHSQFQQEYEFVIAKRKLVLKRQQLNYITNVINQFNNTNQPLNSFRLELSNVSNDSVIQTQNKQDQDTSDTSALSNLDSENNNYKNEAESVLNKIFNQKENNELKSQRNSLHIKMSQTIQKMDELEAKVLNDQILKQQTQIKRTQTQITYHNSMIRQRLTKPFSRSKVSDIVSNNKNKHTVGFSELIKSGAIQKMDKNSRVENGFDNQIIIFDQKELSLRLYAAQNSVGILRELKTKDLFILDNYSDEFPKEFETELVLLGFQQIYQNYGLVGLSWGNSIFIVLENEMQQWIDHMVSEKTQLLQSQ